MKSLIPVPAERVLGYLARFGCVATQQLSGFNVLPVGLKNRRDFSFIFINKVESVNCLDGLRNCIILGPEIVQFPDDKTLAYVCCDDPRSMFFEAVSDLFTHGSQSSSIHPSAKIHPSANIGLEVGIAANVVVGAGCYIGDRTEVRSGVVLHDNVSVGCDCIIKSGSIIGQEGFGIYKSRKGVNSLIPHLGGVLIGDRVLIGALNTVCSGTLDPTCIGNDTKLDDHVHIAHNCVIGSNVLITACAELSGSVTIGDDVWVGPQSAIMNKISIGERTFIGLGAIVTKSVGANKVIAGNPARILRERE